MVEDNLLRFLTSSDCRIAILDALFDSTRRPNELVSKTSASRSSVQRCLRELQEKQLVEKEGRAYRQTRLGNIVYEEYERTRRAFTLAVDSRRLINAMDDGIDGFDPLWLSNATVSVTEENNPQEPIDEYVRRLESLQPDWVHGLYPVTSVFFNRVHCDLLSNGTDTQLVIPEQRVKSRNEFADPPASVEFDRRISRAEFGFGLCVTPERVFVGGFENGQMMGCAELIDEAALTWGETTFDSHWADARSQT